MLVYALDKKARDLTTDDYVDSNPHHPFTDPQRIEVIEWNAGEGKVYLTLFDGTHLAYVPQANVKVWRDY